MARGRETLPEVQAAVMAALLAGQGVCEVAEQFKIDKSVVSRIKGKIPKDKLQQLATKKGEDFESLIEAYLRETLITLTVQVRFFRNETWLNQQPAAELATLHGVQADKAFRLFEAIEQAHEIADGEAPEPDVL